MSLLNLRILLGVIVISVALTACARVLERTYEIVVDGVTYTVNEYSLMVVGLEESQRITEVIVNGVPVSCEFFDFVTDCEAAVRAALSRNGQWDEGEGRAPLPSPEPYTPPADIGSPGVGSGPVGTGGITGGGTDDT